MNKINRSTFNVDLSQLIPVSCPDLHTIECRLNAPRLLPVTLRRVHNGFNVHLVVIIHDREHDIKLHDSPFTGAERDAWVALWTQVGDKQAQRRHQVRTEAIRDLVASGVFPKAHVAS